MDQGDIMSDNPNTDEIGGNNFPLELPDNNKSTSWKQAAPVPQQLHIQLTKKFGLKKLNSTQNDNHTLYKN